MSEIPTYDVNELIARVSQGDEASFKKLYDLYRNRVFSISWKFAGSRALAEDIMQEVFIKLWLHREKLSDIRSFDAYLNVITRNHILNYLRKLSFEENFLRNLSAGETPVVQGNFDAVAYNELQGALHKAVSLLPPQQKKVYFLSRMEGLKYEEISTCLNISRSAVKNHIVEARRFIKNYLHHYAGALVFWLLS